MHQAICTVSKEPFTISDKEEALLKRMGFPLPTLSPDERLRTLMATRNEWKLYRRTCDSTGTEILSAYPKESPFTVYRNDIWWGDSWDALSYGRPYDFSTPFFMQYQALQLVVPREGTSVFRSENCDYDSHIRDSKNCYLNSLVAKCEDCHYCYWIVNDKDVVDSFYTNNSTLCYQCRDCEKCYQCVMLEECTNCTDCMFSFQLIGCSSCLFCSNLANKTYHLFNKPCTKEEFESARKDLLSGSYRTWQEGKKQYREMRDAAVHRGVHTLNCENVLGDHLINSRNCTYAFDGADSEDCMNSISLDHSKDVDSAYSAGWPGCEVVYCCAVSRACQDIAFCRYSWFCNDLRYCDSCVSCKHCFGCIGLRQKEYCILNTQYTKEEYETLLPRIIEHMKATPLRSLDGSSAGCEWGQFFPGSSMPYAYNETGAHDFFPLPREEALARGFLWRDAPDEVPTVKRSIAASSLPDKLKVAPANLLETALLCEVTGRPFKIVKKELEFYQKMGLPLPRIHPTERNRVRLLQRNPHHLWQRACTNCAKKTSTSYQPDRPEKVYCEECYLKEVY